MTSLNATSPKDFPLKQIRETPEELVGSPIVTKKKLDISKMQLQITEVNKINNSIKKL